MYARSDVRAKRANADRARRGSRNKYCASRLASLVELRDPVPMDSAPGRLPPTRVTDPKAVAAITHPLRMRLLGELARRGSARAVDLAEVVGEPANAVSFHLRQLARYGLIEENPERAQNRRERWWRQTSDRGFHIDIEAIREREDGEAAVDTLRRVAEGHVVALHRAIRDQRSRTAPGQDPLRSELDVISGDFAVRLTRDELKEMRQELNVVLERWTEKSRSAGPDDEGERRGYYGVVMAAPEDDMFRAYNDQEDQRS